MSHLSWKEKNEAAVEQMVINQAETDKLRKELEAMKEAIRLINDNLVGWKQRAETAEESFKQQHRISVEYLIRAEEAEAKVKDWTRRAESCESKLGQLEANEKVMELEVKLKESIPEG